jgi:L-lysine exporter family protein LysE/ArgO
VGGAVVLLAYAALSVRRAVRSAESTAVPAPSRQDRAAVVAACLAFTWLNPAVYLDTLVLLGSVAQAHAGRQWWFGGGAALGSVLWFAALAAAAASAHSMLTRPAIWRRVDWFVAVVMTVTAVRLLAGTLG